MSLLFVIEFLMIGAVIGYASHDYFGGRANILKLSEKIKNRFEAYQTEDYDFKYIIINAPSVEKEGLSFHIKNEMMTLSGYFATENSRLQFFQSFNIPYEVDEKKSYMTTVGDQIIILFPKLAESN